MDNVQQADLGLQDIPTEKTMIWSKLRFESNKLQTDVLSTLFKTK